ncbi:MAG TPA: MFS transporter [Rhodospirillaceae bacterium]|nr:MFS transporter [Rhodospirillaceae bacterium]
MNRSVVTLCLAEALSLIGAFAFPALLPNFRAAWQLSNFEAGWIAGIFFLGYALFVPVLTSLTDRIDAKHIFVSGAAMTAVGIGGFALFAQGFWTAMLFRLLGGIGLAGIYMPGLKALVDRLEGPHQARAISFYTASFSLGTMLSFLFIGELGERVGWQNAFGLAALAAVLALFLAQSLPACVPKSAPETSGHLLDFRPIWRNRPAMGYVLGYASHMWELFVFRSWVVAFLVFAKGDDPLANTLTPTFVATLAALMAMGCSLLGADLALRFERRRICGWAMVLSGTFGLLFGQTACLPYWLAALAAVVYGGLIQLDSAALTTGAILLASPGRQGATAALHSLLGFAAAFFGPLAHGALLDLLGGGASTRSWWLAFAASGCVALMGPIALSWGRHRARG